MFRGFDLRIFEDYAESLISDYYKRGLQVSEKKRDTINNTIESFKISDNRLDGEKMSTDWFPTIDADVFISHSHRDENLAIALSGFLKTELNLEPFIDSIVWKYSDDLQKMIDKVYCRNQGRDTYDYHKRNYSTSHVHMMLSVALTKMIDNSECLLFLNTPESITPLETISGTESPWIYSELSMTRLIHKKTPAEHRKNEIAKSKCYAYKGLFSEQKLKIVHKVNLDHFTQIRRDDLVNWLSEYRSDHDCHSLDMLYSLHPEPDF